MTARPRRTAAIAARRMSAASVRRRGVLWNVRGVGSPLYSPLVRSRRELADGTHDLVELERLLDHAVDAAALEVVTVLARDGGLEHHRDALQVLVLAHAVVELDAGHAGEADVEHEEVGLDLLERLEGLGR